MQAKLKKHSKAAGVDDGSWIEELLNDDREVREKDSRDQLTPNITAPSTSTSYHSNSVVCPAEDPTAKKALESPPNPSGDEITILRKNPSSPGEVSEAASDDELLVTGRGSDNSDILRAIQESPESPGGSHKMRPQILVNTNNAITGNTQLKVINNYANIADPYNELKYLLNLSY